MMGSQNDESVIKIFQVCQLEDKVIVSKNSKVGTQLVVFMSLLLTVLLFVS